VLISAQFQTYVPGAPSPSPYLLSGGDVSVPSIKPGSDEPFDNAGGGAGLAEGDPGHYRAVSEDGSRVYFTAPDSTTFGSPIFGAQLYLRKNIGSPTAETVRVSAPEPGVSDPLGTWAAFYRGASADGRRAFLTSCEKLTSDATADASGGDLNVRNCSPGETSSDLYLFDANANDGAGDLVDLTTGDSRGAGVLGVVGVNEDGTRVSFVATGELAGAAIRGRPNLYVWELGEGITHVAALADADEGVWVDFNRADKEARSTPDGRHLIFTSTAKLSPLADGNATQVYLFNVDQPHRLECVSCTANAGAPTGATISNQVKDQPSFDATLTSATLEKRNLTDDGQRAFFETQSPLVPKDTNGQIDVYEYDAVAQSLRLLSTGQSSTRSVFAGASRDGQDAFFWTREPLVRGDDDFQNDIYDARIGGGLFEPRPDECVVDCDDPLTSPPVLATPRSNATKSRNANPGPRPALRLRRLTRAQVARLARGKRIAVRVRVNRSGWVRFVARAEVAGHRTVVARAARRARRAGVVKLPLKLSLAARRAIGENRRLSVVLSVAFQGASRQRHVRIDLRLPSVSAGGGTQR
jgi:hypothetical protein